MANFSTEALAIAKEIALEKDADLYLYSAGITRENGGTFCAQLAKIKPKRTNAALILTTIGGDPDAAFLMARCLQRAYGKFSIYIFGPCKSAGTLVVIGAREIIVSDSGELGPLDIQLGKDDELFIRSSGLDVTESMVYLRDLASEVFFNQFIRLKVSGSITTKTAAEISQSIALGIVTPILNQIDPLKLGEVQRSMRIAKDYGKLLNPTFSELDTLVSGYPSHSFAIDREQAKKIFQNVRPPTDKENELNRLLHFVVETDRDIIELLTPPDPVTPIIQSKNEPASLHENKSTNGDTAPNAPAASPTASATVGR
jgi:serine dehydrogenase proteinase